MLNLRYTFRLTIAFIVKFKGIITIGIFLGVIFFLLSRLIAPMYLGRSMEVIGITGRYHPDDLPYSILNLLSEGLTKTTEDGTIEPALASSWETPDKGKTWIFELNDDAYWQDEEKVESYDIVYEFSDVEIEKPDSKTIVFKLKDPFSPFPSIVSKPTFRKGLLGTGEWKVKKLSLAGSYVSGLTIEKSSSKDESGKDNKQTKVFKFYPTEDTTKLAFKLGEINKIENSLNIKPFDSWETVKVEAQSNENQLVVIFFNNQDSLLSDKKLRQALIYAVDKTKFDATRAISPITPNSWAYNSQVKRYKYDADRAQEVIDELPNEIQDNLSIKLVTTPQLLTTAEEISDQWKEIGVNSLVQVSSVIPTDFQAFLTIFDIPVDPDQYSLWHSTQVNSNISKYKNPRIDKLLEDGRISLNLEERRGIYIDFQRFLLEDLPAAFLYHPTLYNIERK